VRPVDIVLVLTVVTIWGGNFIAMRTGALEIPPYFLLTLRVIVATTALVWFAKSPRGMVVPLMAISFTLCLLHFGLAHIGLRKIEAGTGALAMQASVPFAALLAWIFFREHFGWRRILGFVFAVTGLTVISGVPQISDHTDKFLIMVLSALCFAIATIQIRRLGSVNFMSVNAWICIFSIPMSLAISIIFEEGQWTAIKSAEPSVYFGILYMGLIASVFGQSLWYRLLPRYETNQVMPYTLLVPVLGIVFGILFLDESLNWQLVLGGLITIAGVGIIVLRGSKSVIAERALAKNESDER
jgi:O-acetylserine/cysteine efflux transporter